MKDFLIILLFTITFCIGKASNGKDSLFNSFSVKYNSKNDEISIINNFTNQEISWGRVDNFDSNHYHSAEYHKPNLYVIRQFDSKKPNWSDELWVYSSPLEGKLLLKKQGLDFRVNKKQTLISYYNVDTLIIFNLLNNKTRRIHISEDTNKVKEYLLGSLCWDLNKDVIWGVLTWCCGDHYCFFRYDYSKDELTKYNIPKGCSFEYDINPNLDLLLYSDYPFLVDTDSENELRRKKTEIHLYVYDFRTKKQKLISTSISKEFNPKWITEDIIEINSLTTNKRERIKYLK